MILVCIWLDTCNRFSSLYSEIVEKMGYQGVVK